MSDLTKLTAEELQALSPEQLLRWLLMFRGGEWYAETRRRLERLEKCEALNGYANHRATCSHWNADIAGDCVCSCGYDAARAALEE